MWSDSLGEGAAAPGGAPAELPGVTVDQAKKSKNLWSLFVMFFLMGWIIYSVQQTTALHATSLGFSPEQVAGILQFLFLGNMLAQIPMGMLADRFGVRKVLPAGLVVFTASLVLLIIPDADFTRLSIVGFIVGAAVVLMAGFLPIVIREVFGLRDYASILGWGIAARTIGIAVGPPLHNLVYDLLGSYQSAFIAYVVVMGLGVVLAIIGTKKIVPAQTQTQVQA
jgi:MFS family permease